MQPFLCYDVPENNKNVQKFVDVTRHSIHGTHFPRQEQDNTDRRVDRNSTHQEQRAPRFHQHSEAVKKTKSICNFGLVVRNNLRYDTSDTNVAGTLIIQQPIKLFTTTNFSITLRTVAVTHYRNLAVGENCNDAMNIEAICVILLKSQDGLVRRAAVRNNS